MVRSVSSIRVSSAINFKYVLRSCIWVLEVSILFLYWILNCSDIVVFFVIHFIFFPKKLIWMYLLCQNLL